MNDTLSGLPRGLFRMAGNIRPPEEQANSFSTIFLAGFARSGKTLITQKLTSQYGMTEFGLDRIRNAGYARTHVRRSFFDLLLKLYPRGLVVEGDNLSGENLSKGIIQNESELMNTIHFLRSHGAQAYFVGNADTSVEEKVEALHSYRQKNVCWTSNRNYSTAQLRNLAVRSIRYSQSLREFAEKADATYFDLRPAHYNEDAKRAIIEITSRSLIL